MENKIKHLEMIQSIIKRMAQNSFMIKGWTMTLVVAVVAFVPKVAYLFILTLLLAVILFACLDVYYLQLERRYRKLYDIIREKAEEDINFDLKITEVCKTSENQYLNCLISKSILLFYIPIIVICIGISIALFV